MLKWDKEYYNLLKKILNEGIEVENRTLNNTIKIPCYNFSLNVGEEFPVLTTKQVFTRGTFLELLWIYLEQSNNVEWLKQRDVHIWDEWEIDEEGYYTTHQKIKQNDGTFKVEEVKRFFGKEYANTIGTSYGYVVNKFKKTQKALDLIQNHPENRRNVVSLWYDDYLSTGVLEPCVWSHEIDVTDGKINMMVHQRSADVPLGLPFNVTQYALLMCLYASVSGLKPGILSWSIKDAHIYLNQLDGINEQIKRSELVLKYEIKSKEELRSIINELKSKEINENSQRIINVCEYLLNELIPKIYINPEIKDFFKFDTSRDCKDIKIIDYKHLGKISMPVSE